VDGRAHGRKLLVTQARDATLEAGLGNRELDI
jgi:hypothetical protein